MPRILAAYRPEDSSISEHICQRLSQIFGQNQISCVSGTGGGQSVTALQRAVRRCDIVLVIIGPQWLHVPGAPDARQLDQPDDAVRIMLGAALNQTNKILIPVLVNGAEMPTSTDLPVGLSAFAKQVPISVRGGEHLEADISRLHHMIVLRSYQTPARPLLWISRLAVAALLIGAVVLVVNMPPVKSAVTELLRGNPSTRAAELTGEGWRNYYQRNTEQAIADFESAISFDPEYVEAYRGLARAYDRLGDEDKTLEYLSLAIQHSIASAALYAERGWFNSEIGRYEDAVQDFTEVLRVNENDTETYSGRAWANFNAGFYDDALSDFNAIIALAPDSAESYAGLGWTYYQQGEYEQMRASFEQAVRFRPNGDNYLGLATAFDALGMPTEAIINYNRYLERSEELDPDIVERVKELAESLQ